VWEPECLAHETLVGTEARALAVEAVGLSTAVQKELALAENTGHVNFDRTSHFDDAPGFSAIDSHKIPPVVILFAARGDPEIV
jgi:hypothetical protein